MSKILKIPQAQNIFSNAEIEKTSKNKKRSKNMKIPKIKT